jgi:hypothetical protein
MEAALDIKGSERDAGKWLDRSAKLCFGSVALGQLLFALFILAFYYTSTLRGDFAAWDTKPNIEGYAAGDMVGNVFFAIHVLIAAILTLGGLVQLLPLVRSRWPLVHRWNGRLYMTSALLLATGGFWLVWIRGTWLNLPGAIGITLNGVLIIFCAIMAWRGAITRRLIDHRRWAIRLFALASAVWFMRVGYMAWGMATGGVGVGEAMDGPFDIFLAFANSLLPLAVAELYLRAQSGSDSMVKLLAAATLSISALIILGGSIGAWLFMWSPHI